MQRFGTEFAFGNGAMFRTNCEAIIRGSQSRLHARRGLIRAAMDLAVAMNSVREARANDVAEYKEGDAWK